MRIQWAHFQLVASVARGVNPFVMTTLGKEGLSIATHNGRIAFLLLPARS